MTTTSIKERERRTNKIVNTMVSRRISGWVLNVRHHACLFVVPCGVFYCRHVDRLQNYHVDKIRRCVGLAPNAQRLPNKSTTEGSFNVNVRGRRRSRRSRDVFRPETRKKRVIGDGSHKEWVHVLLCIFSGDTPICQSFFRRLGE